MAKKSNASADFAFERVRGLAWVCDVAKSTRALNDDASVDALEEFLPRLYWTAMQSVESAGGVFVKWTGDGFFAWFETKLERAIGRQACSIFTAVYHLTLLNNVTQLGIKAPKKFRLRHAVSYEPDALQMRITDKNGHVGHDVLGRGIVHAFRMCSIECAFPSLISEARVVRAYTDTAEAYIPFKRRLLTADERLSFFKGERFGTESIYASADRTPRLRSHKSVIKQGKRALARLESSDDISPLLTDFVNKMLEGPQWSRDAILEQSRYIKEDLAGNLEKALRLIEQRAKEK